MSRILFDLETAPLPDAADYLIEPIAAPSNYKDEAKIAAYIAEKQAERLARCALDPDLCQIIACGVFTADRGVTVVISRGNTEDEHTIVDYVLGAHEYVGFNILAFDLPVLFTRARYLALRKNPHISLARYRHDCVIDLAEELTFGDTRKMHSLSFYAKRYGIPYDDSVKGEDIPRLYAAGDWDAIRRHVTSDVLVTKALCDRLGIAV